MKAETIKSKIEGAYGQGFLAAEDKYGPEKIKLLKDFIIELGVRAQVILPVTEAHLKMWDDQFDVRKSDWLERFHKLTDKSTLK